MIYTIVKYNRVQILTLMFLCFVLFIFLGFSVHIISDSKESYESLKRFDSSNAFMTQDSTSDLDLNRLFSDNDAVTRCSQYFHDLNDDGILYYTAFGYNMYYDQNGNIIREENVTPLFFDMYQIKTSNGRLFNDSDYSQINEYVPVLVGYELRNSYIIGETYTFESASSSELYTGYVIGVLSKNSSYIEPSNSSVEISLDYSYLIPFGSAYINDSRGLSDYDMALTRAVYFPRTDVEKDKIIKMQKNMNTFSLSLVDIGEEAEQLLKIEKQQIIVFSIILGLLAVVVIISAYFSFSKIIQKSYFEIGVRLLTGARRIRLISEIALLISTIILFSSIPSFIFLSLHDMSLKLLIILSASAISIAIIIMIYPALRINRLNISDIMRKE